TGLSILIPRAQASRFFNDGPSMSACGLEQFHTIFTCFTFRLCYNVRVFRIIIITEREVRSMHLVAISLNYRTAPVEIREQYTFVEEQLPEALQTLKRTKSIVECVIVSTCNRTEIYAVVDRLHMCG